MQANTNCLPHWHCTWALSQIKPWYLLILSSTLNLHHGNNTLQYLWLSLRNAYNQKRLRIGNLTTRDHLVPRLTHSNITLHKTPRTTLIPLSLVLLVCTTPTQSNVVFSFNSRRDVGTRCRCDGGLVADRLASWTRNAIITFNSLLKLIGILYLNNVKHLW